MTPVNFAAANITLLGDGDKVADIRARRDVSVDGIPSFATVWEPTDEERKAIALGCNVVMWTFSVVFAPAALGVLDTDGTVIGHADS